MAQLHPISNVKRVIVIEFSCEEEDFNQNEFESAVDQLRGFGSVSYRQFVSVEEDRK